MTKRAVRNTPFGTEYYNDKTKKVEFEAKPFQQVKDYANMKVTELRSMAEAKGLDKDSKVVKKQDLVEWLMKQDD